MGEVAGGVEITIEHQRALLAAEHPVGEAQLGFHHATARTGFRGRVPAVRDVHGTPDPTGLVLDLAAELAHADPGDVPGQTLILEHPGDVEVLDHDRAVSADQTGGQLVQAIAAGVRDGGVQARDASLGALPPPRGLPSGTAVRADAARGLALQAPQFSLRYLEMAGVGDDLTGRQHRQGLDTQVDAHYRGRSSRCRVLSFDLDGQRAEPAPALVGDRDGPDAGGAAFDVPGQLPGRLVRAHYTDPGQSHLPPVAVDRAEAAGGEPARHRLAFPFEPGETDLRPRTGAVVGGFPVVQCGREVGQAAGVGLFRVLRPPRRNVILGLVPPLA
ncbi:MAG: hypothetical protein ABIQ18_36135 [Umezawaea sp.]